MVNLSTDEMDWNFGDVRITTDREGWERECGDLTSFNFSKEIFSLSFGCVTFLFILPFLVDQEFVYDTASLIDSIFQYNCIGVKVNYDVTEFGYWEWEWRVIYQQLVNVS